MAKNTIELKWVPSKRNGNKRLEIEDKCIQFTWAYSEIPTTPTSPSTRTHSCFSVYRRPGKKCSPERVSQNAAMKFSLSLINVPVSSECDTLKCLVTVVFAKLFRPLAPINLFEMRISRHKTILTVNWISVPRFLALNSRYLSMPMYGCVRFDWPTIVNQINGKNVMRIKWRWIRLDWRETGVWSESSATIIVNAHSPQTDNQQWACV